MKKQDIEYLNSVYIVWRMVMYYQGLMGLDVEESAMEMVLQLENSSDGLTFMHFVINKNAHSERKCTPQEMKNICNEWLNAFASELPFELYSGGRTAYDLVVPLYVEEILDYDQYLVVRVLSIEDPVSFAYFRRREREVVI